MLYHDQIVQSVEEGKASCKVVTTGGGYDGQQLTYSQDATLRKVLRASLVSYYKKCALIDDFAAGRHDSRRHCVAQASLYFLTSPLLNVAT